MKASQLVFTKESEARTRTRITAFLREKSQQDPEGNADQLLDCGGFISRFDYCDSKIPDDAKEALLISGCSIGTEAVVARNYGFRSIHGTEVSEEYIDIAQERFEGHEGFQFDYYDGDSLPYEDGQFSMIVSGHIIEHTRNPFRYLCEHMRVLKKGGFFFMEYPTRYNITELHTRVRSVEYFPKPIRYLLLKLFSSKLSPFSVDDREHYRNILESRLKPISIWQIALYLIGTGHSPRAIKHSYSPVRGFVRLIIEK